MSYVTFKSSSGMQLTMLLGETSPIISDGVSTWDTVPRPKRDALTRYTGRDPFKQDIPVMFDGHENSKSCEQDIAKLVKMSTQEHTIKLSGQALLTGREWVIEGITWDDQNTLWKRDKPKPVRVRQSAVVHLLEHIKDVVITTPAAPVTHHKKKKGPRKKIKTPKGMTAKQIAQIEFGDPSKWRKIYDDNPWLGPPDPRYVIPAGTELVIIDGKVPFFTVP